MRLPHPQTLLRAAVAVAAAGVVVAGIARLWLGLDLSVHAHWLPGCPFRALTGVACPGCGSTRALLLLGQLEAAAAFRANPVAPLLLLAAAVRAVRPLRVPSGLRAPAAAVALVAVLGAWVARGFA